MKARASFAVKKTDCPVEYALNIIGGKWIPSILWSLTEQKRPIRFSEIQKKNPKINERVLSRSLKFLEAQGMLHRKDHKKNPPHVEYSLTSLGRSLGPSLQELCKWAKTHGFDERKS